MSSVKNSFGAFAAAVDAAAASPFATVLAFIFVAVWAASGPRLHNVDVWALIMNTASSVVTLLMVFILNNTQTRDTQAINAKLDALILAVEAADNRLIGLERLPHTEIDAAQEEVHSLRQLAEEAKQLHEDIRRDEDQ